MRHSAALLLLTSASFLLGFWRDVEIASSFGGSAVSDALFLALVVPVFVENILGVALRDALIPRLKTAQGAGTYNVEVTELGRIVLPGALLVTLIFCMLPAFWVGLLAPGWTGVQATLARDMFLVGALSLAVLVWSYFQAGVLSAEGRLTLPGWRSVLFNVGAIGAIYLAPASGTAVLVGMVGGQVLHLFWMQAVLGKKGLAGETVGAGSVPLFLRGFFPLLGATVALQINVVAERFFASWLEAGSIAALAYAFRLASAPVVLLSLSVIAVLFPALVTQGLAVDRGYLPDLLRKGVKLTLLTLVPVSVFLTVCAEPAVKLLFQRGAFGAHDTAITAQASVAYALGLPAMGLALLGGRAVLALGLSQSVLTAALLAMTATLSLDVLLWRPYGAAGLALALSGGAAVHAALLWWAVLQHCWVTDFGASVLRWLVAGIGAGLLLALGTWADWTGVIAGGVASVLLCWALAWALGERFSVRLLRFHEAG
ncbi:MAG: murein biosynthesis integral membrane protein MurJ [Gammaproteobacteria bacterium]